MEERVSGGCECGMGGDAEGFEKEALPDGCIGR